MKRGLLSHRFCWWQCSFPKVNYCVALRGASENRWGPIGVQNCWALNRVSQNSSRLGRSLSLRGILFFTFVQLSLWFWWAKLLLLQYWLVQVHFCLEFFAVFRSALRDCCPTNSWLSQWFSQLILLDALFRAIGRCRLIFWRCGTRTKPLIADNRGKLCTLLPWGHYCVRRHNLYMH